MGFINVVRRVKRGLFPVNLTLITVLRGFSGSWAIAGVI